MTRKKNVDGEAVCCQLQVLSEVLVAGTLSGNPDISSVCFSAMLQISKRAGLQERTERTAQPVGSVSAQSKEIEPFDISTVDQTVVTLLEALHMGLSTIKNKRTVETGDSRKAYGDILINLAAANQTSPKICYAILRIAELLDFKPSQALHYKLFVLATHQTHEIANTAVLLLMRFGLENLIHLNPVRAAESYASRLSMLLADYE